MNNAVMDLLRSAVYHGMKDLCSGYLDMPCGCGGCPLYDENDVDDDGNVNCYDALFEKFLNEHREELADLGLMLR